jgi:mycothiol synthase
MIEYVSADGIDPTLVSRFLALMAPPNGGEALSEHKAVRIGGSSDSRAIVGIDASGEIAQYAQAAWHGPVRPDGDGHWAVEVVVDEGIDAESDVGRIVEVLRRILSGGERIVAWAAQDHIAAGFRRAGYRETRRLLRMGRRLPLGGASATPPGVRIEPFVVGEQEDDWLALNNAAFAGHPENGALRRSDLAERLARPWFDAAGSLVRAGRRSMSAASVRSTSSRSIRLSGGAGWGSAC